MTLSLRLADARRLVLLGLLIVHGWGRVVERVCVGDPALDLRGGLRQSGSLVEGGALRFVVLAGQLSSYGFSWVRSALRLGLRGEGVLVHDGVLPKGAELLAMILEGIIQTGGMFRVSFEGIHTLVGP